MKACYKSAATLLFLFFATFTAEAQNVRMEAKNIASTKATSTAWQSWTSYNKSFQREARIQIDCSSLGQVPVPVTVSWYFIGKSLLSTASNRTVVARGSKELTLESKAGTTSFEASSGRIASTDENYRPTNDRTVTGSKIEGWVVVMKGRDGATLSTATSASYLVDWLKANIPEAK